MYVVLALVVVIAAGLVFLLARARVAIQAGRRRRVMGERLAAAARRGQEADRRRRAAADSETALTALIPAIQSAHEGPRRVA